MNSISPLSYTRLLTLVLFLSGIYNSCFAFDLECTGTDGQQYYFNIISTTDVEVTYCDTLPRGHYKGEAIIPSTVTSTQKYNVVSIGDGAFSYCPELTSIQMPGSITRIGKGAFSWCSGLKNFDIPSSIEEIAPYAFQGCSSLSEFSVEAANQSFTAYDGLILSKDRDVLVAYPPGKEGDLVIPSSVKSLAEGCLFDCYLLSSIHIPLSVTEIGKNSIYNCGDISTVTISSDVTTIGEGAFGECASLKQFNISPSNQAYHTDSIAIYSSTGILTHFAPAATQYYKVADETQGIGAEAFFRNYQLTGIQLPEGLKDIGDLAFTECWELNSIELPSTIKSIGYGAFALCEGLNSIYSNIADPASVDLGDCAFFGIDQDNCVLYVPQGKKEEYQKQAQWNDFATIREFESLMDQEIVWPQSLTGLEVGNEIWLNAYATSHLEVEYVITQGSSLVSLLGKRLCLHKSGTVVVEARQNGNGRYRPASTVIRSIDISTNALASVTNDNISVRGNRGFISIEGADFNDIACIYTPEGRLVYKGRSRTILLPTGFYIVTIDSTTAKVLVN